MNNNLNFLLESGFIFEIEKLPLTSFFVQSCNIPTSTLVESMVSTPMLDYKINGNKLTYDSLKISFIVDENINNYNEIVSWMIGISNPESLSNNKIFTTNEKNRLGLSTHFQSLFSDALLHSLSNNNNENVTIKFYDIFPIGLSGLKFYSNGSDLEYITCTATFKYSHFEIDK